MAGEGLKLKTVSGTFSKFADEGLIEVQHLHVHIVRLPELRAMIDAPGART